MRILIAGGGFCGLDVARKLDYPHLDVTLIDEKEYFEYYPSLPKLLTDPSYHEKIIVSYADILEHVEVVQDTIEKINENKIILEDEEMEYDYLVIATGSEYPVFLEEEKNVSRVVDGGEIKNNYSFIEKAGHVLVIGGGLIGVESAAEIATKTDKKVTVVHPPDRLIERNPEKASRYAEKFLEKHGVDIVFGRKIVGKEENIYFSDKQGKIQADCGLWCAGIVPNTEFMELDSSCFDEQKRIKVNSRMQVKGYDNIFAGGDLVALDEEKTAQNADFHSRVIADNIERLIKGVSLKEYKSFKGPLLIGLGDKYALMVWGSFVLPGRISAILKNLLEKAALFRLKHLPKQI